MKLSSTSETSSLASVKNSEKRIRQKPTLLPGLVVTSAIAGLAILLSRGLRIDELNPLLIAVLIGMGWRQCLKLPAVCRPGIQFAMKKVLRLAVILLGLRLSIDEVLAVGPAGLAIVVVSSVSTFYLTCWLGHALRVNRRLTHLIAAGTSICGASAVVATNAVVEGSEEDMTYAIATITGFGTFAMLTYPLVGGLLDMSPETFGIWSGASIHEVAQVIATAFQRGDASGELATITKLTRVLMIMPLMLGLSFQIDRDRVEQSPRSSRISIPWFVLFFCGLVALNSLNIVPSAIKTFVLSGNQFLLCMALAAMGLEANLAQLKQLGMKPIYLAGVAWMFLAGVSLSAIALLGV